MTDEMTTSRYVIARDGFPDLGDVVCGLPDAEHIHLTRLPDGRWSAVAMAKVGTFHGQHGFYFVPVDGEGMKAAWVDAPTEPEDGAR